MFTTTLCQVCTAIVTVPNGELVTRPCLCRCCGAPVVHEPCGAESTAAEVLVFPAAATRGARAA